MNTPLFATLASLTCALPCIAGGATTVHAIFPAPTLDRWMYPFNATPGTRPAASTFGSTSGEADFDNRDAQVLVAFDTDSAVEPGLGTGADPLAPGVRSAFAADTSGDGALRDISNCVRERFDPAPWAIGTIAGLAPGSLVPAGSIMRFELAVERADVQAYLRGALDEGAVALTLSSLTLVHVMGGQYPSFVMKEHALAVLGLATPPRLEIEVRIGDACAAADLTCDGAVNGADLGVLLANWGGTGAADLTGDGTVNGADLGVLLAAWGDA